MGREEKPLEGELDSIEANVVVLEIVDTKTGLPFKRTLPLEYVENSNGILLRGEDFTGNPSQIVFLSELALKKTLDITGKGPDSPHHRHDEEKEGE